MEYGPLNSGLEPFSKYQTVDMVKISMETMTVHISVVKGFKKIRAVSSDFAGTIIDNPDSVYGSVKSTYCILSATMVMSPTTASKVSHHFFSSE